MYLSQSEFLMGMGMGQVKRTFSNLNIFLGQSIRDQQLNYLSDLRFYYNPHHSFCDKDILNPILEFLVVFCNLWHFLKLTEILR